MGYDPDSEIVASKQEPLEMILPEVQRDCQSCDSPCEDWPWAPYSLLPPAADECMDPDQEPVGFKFIFREWRSEAKEENPGKTPLGPDDAPWLYDASVPQLPTLEYTLGCLFPNSDSFHSCWNSHAWTTTKWINLLLKLVWE